MTQHYLIGIDDTDNAESRGTGYLSRCLASEIAAAGLGRVTGIARHQLLVDPRIPYTSHNSAISLEVRSDGPSRELIAFSRQRLEDLSADGADVGLCLAEERSVSHALHDFGRRAKVEVLSREEATTLAGASEVYLEGITGDYSGVIGALAAVGLRAGGNDGRFIWLRGVRELRGSHTVERLYELTDIDAVRTLDGTPLPLEAIVNVEPWPRPVVIAGRAVLLVEPANGPGSGWQLLPREVIRRY